MLLKKDLGIAFVVFTIGTILGTIGTVSFPIGSNMSYFWPAAVIQSTGGLFFGIWGVLAGALFPSLSNLLTDGTSSHVFGLIPANFIQSFIPLLIKNAVGFKPFEFNKKTVLWFIFGCAVIPHIIGGFLGCSTLYLFGDIPNQTIFWVTFRVWIIGNIPCSILFGLLLLKVIAPILKDCNLYYEGYVT